METLENRAQLLERLRAERSLPTPKQRRVIRERAGASLRDVAGALGVSHSLVRYWEQGGMPREHRDAYGELLDELRLLTLNEPARRR